MDDFLHPAIWGLMGAAIYALPRLSACLFAVVAVRASITKCVGEAVVSLLIGVISAMAFGARVARFIHQDGTGDLEAVCAVIGLIANPASPAVIDALSGQLIARLRGGRKA